MDAVSQMDRISFKIALAILGIEILQKSFKISAAIY